VARGVTRAWFALALVLVASACTSAPAVVRVASPVEAVEATVARFVAALNNLDLRDLDRLLEDHATAFLPSPQLRARIEGREAIVAALAPIFDAERKRVPGPPYSHLQVQGLLVQRSGATAIATFDVGTPDVSSRRTLVLVQRGSAWKVVHFHASNVRPPG
jgi:ketosteroid isomerase-like protein